MLRRGGGGALKVAQLLGDTRSILAHIDAGGPRLVTELVGEIEATRVGVPEAARELRRTRALVHATLGTVPATFEAYLEASEATNDERQRYMRSYLKLEGVIDRLAHDRGTGHRLLLDPPFATLVYAARTEPPGAFHAAGVDHVVGTLWKVNQLATAVLLRRYFELTADASTPRAEALRTAQLELRAMTRDELSRWVEEHCPGQPAAARKAILAAIARFDEAPFAHPAW